jgi:hypothetical protein
VRLTFHADFTAFHEGVMSGRNTAIETNFSPVSLESTATSTSRPTRSFESAISEAPARPSRPGLLQVGVQALTGGGPVGMIANGVRALVGGGDSREAEIDRMWQMQADNQMFNLEYMALQQSIQDENRRFTTTSNLLKAQFDTSKAAINNIRV